MFRKRIMNNMPGTQIIIAGRTLKYGQTGDFTSFEISKHVNASMFRENKLIYIDTIEDEIENLIRADTIEAEDLKDKSITLDKLSDDVKTLLMTTGSSNIKEWNPLTFYPKGEEVIYDNTLYSSIVDHNSSNIFEINRWQEINGKIMDGGTF